MKFVWTVKSLWRHLGPKSSFTWKLILGGVVSKAYPKEEEIFPLIYPSSVFVTCSPPRSNFHTHVQETRAKVKRACDMFVILLIIVINHRGFGRSRPRSSYAPQKQLLFRAYAKQLVNTQSLSSPTFPHVFLLIFCSWISLTIFIGLL